MGSRRETPYAPVSTFDDASDAGDMAPPVPARRRLHMSDDGGATPSSNTAWAAVTGAAGSWSSALSVVVLALAVSQTVLILRASQAFNAADVKRDYYVTQPRRALHAAAAVSGAAAAYMVLATLMPPRRSLRRSVPIAGALLVVFAGLMAHWQARGLRRKTSQYNPHNALFTRLNAVVYNTVATVIVLPALFLQA